MISPVCTGHKAAAAGAPVGAGLAVYPPVVFVGKALTGGVAGGGDDDGCDEAETGGAAVAEAGAGEAETAVADEGAGVAATVDVAGEAGKVVCVDADVDDDSLPPPQAARKVTVTAVRVILDFMLFTLPVVI